MDRRRFLGRMLFAGGVAAVATAGPGIGLVLADDDTDTDTTITDATTSRRRFRTRGEITAIGADPTTIQINGRWIVVDSDVNPDLVLGGELVVGEVVAVVGYVEHDGDEMVYIAQRVGTLDVSPQRKQRFRVVGELTAWDQDAGTLAVDDEEILIDEDVQPLRRVAEGLEVGDFVLVAGVVLDGARYAALIRPGDRRRCDGERFQVRGRLTEVGEDSIVVDDQTIRMSGQTQVRGDLVADRFALVRGVRPSDGDPLALHVVVLPEGVEPRAPHAQSGRRSVTTNPQVAIGVAGAAATRVDATSLARTVPGRAGSVAAREGAARWPRSSRSRLDATRVVPRRRVPRCGSCPTPPSVAGDAHEAVARPSRAWRSRAGGNGFGANPPDRAAAHVAAGIAARRVDRRTRPLAAGGLV